MVAVATILVTSDFGEVEAGVGVVSGLEIGIVMAVVDVSGAGVDDTGTELLDVDSVELMGVDIGVDTPGEDVTGGGVEVGT